MSARPAGGGAASDARSVVGSVPGAVPIWFEDSGPRTGDVVLLVMGQGGQATAWSDDFTSPLLEAGYRIVRFDNRDAGLSGDSDAASYAISDMAADVLRLLDHIGVERAHVVGQSMGGMVAQELAVDAHERVASLTLLSTSPDLGIEPPDLRVFQLVEALADETEEGRVDVAVASVRLQTGPRWPFDEALVRRQVEASVGRASRPEAAMRQLDAAMRWSPRLGDLATLPMPVLVVHGTHDPIFPLAHARAVAETVPHVRLVVVEGMGHAIPWGHWDVWLVPLLDHLASSRSGGG